MPTLDLHAPGATELQVIQALAAAGDVIRRSGMSPEFVAAGRRIVDEHRAGRYRLAEDAWHWRAAEIFDEAQKAALDACFRDGPVPAGGALLIVDSKRPASFLD
jgi:hypothetical protein